MGRVMVHFACRSKMAYEMCPLKLYYSLWKDCAVSILYKLSKPWKSCCKLFHPACSRRTHNVVVFEHNPTFDQFWCYC